MGTPLSINPVVLIDGWPAEVLSVTPTEDGTNQIRARVPTAVAPGDAVPVKIQTTGISGTPASSNELILHVEPGS